MLPIHIQTTWKKRERGVKDVEIVAKNSLEHFLAALEMMEHDIVHTIIFLKWTKPS